ncbi:hypothetical protein WR25_07317 [Diploscapter pachys]|uniref:FIP-RBD domain-containing protein n=1 Tax=Diploscapter pachys TaxID=2018661 RepID=A0A2A2LIP2_9BILA|nr:hypothetical protein WR25_07317 [Diploscapter pachys]
MESNTLLVSVGGARGLTLKNASNFDAVLTIVMDGKSKTKSRLDLEPEQVVDGECRWDTTGEFKLKEELNKLVISVKHVGTFTKDVVGRCQLNLDEARNMGSMMWLPLKKDKDDKKRGEIQLSFQFTYKSPQWSVSSQSLDKLADLDKKEGVASKIKRKMHFGKKLKEASDTTSMVSGISAGAMSVTSTKSRSMFGKLGKALKRSGSSHKLAPGAFDVSANVAGPENQLYPSHDGRRHSILSTGQASRPNSGLSFSSLSELPTAETISSGAAAVSHASSPYPPVRQSIATKTAGEQLQNGAADYTPQKSMDIYNMNSQVSTAESFHRTGSIHSAASSGFESSSKLGKRDNIADIGSHRDLLKEIDSLKLELHVKDSRIREMSAYMDQLLARVMEKNPELLDQTMRKGTARSGYFSGLFRSGGLSGF